MKYLVLDNQTAIKILDSYVTPKIVDKGFKWNGNSLWYSESKNGIRKLIYYQLLKGSQGIFQWGLCFDYVPLISGNSLKWNRTLNNMKLHLFDSSNEYKNSFEDRNISNFAISHLEKVIFENSLKLFISKNENEIFNWFSKCETIENILEIVNYQLESDKLYYKLHSPRPDYIKMFLLSKLQRIEESLLILKSFNFEESIEEKIRKLII